MCYVQQVDQHNVQQAEQPNVQQAEQPNVQQLEQPNAYNIKHSIAQKTEHPDVQHLEQPNVQKAEQPDAQKAEQPDVQKAEQPDVQQLEQPNVQHLEQPNVQKAEQPNAQKVEQMFKCSYCTNKYTTLNGARYHEFKFCKNKPRTIKKSDKFVTHHHKKSIPSPVKRQVWNKYIGEEIGKSKCYCCRLTDITQMSFHAGHVISEKDGGEINAKNLRPICQNCNSSMGTMNMNDFIDKYNLHKNN
jgi:hypothetical protein